MTCALTIEEFREFGNLGSIRTTVVRHPRVVTRLRGRGRRGPRTRPPDAVTARFTRGPRPVHAGGGRGDRVIRRHSLQGFHSIHEGRITLTD